MDNITKYLIWVALGVAITIAIVNLLKKEPTPPIIYDSAYINVIKDNAKKEAKIEILEFQRGQLEIELNELRGKETSIINNNNNFKKNYNSLSPTETDKRYLEIFK